MQQHTPPRPRAQRPVVAYEAVKQWHAPLLDEREPQAINLQGVMLLSQQPIDAARWWTPPTVATNETALQPVTAVVTAETPAVTTVTPVVQPPVTPAEIAEISMKLTRGMSPSNVAKSLKGYDPRDYQSWAAKVATVQDLLKSVDSPAPTTAPIGDTTETRRATAA